jgi:flagellar protein FlaG
MVNAPQNAVPARPAPVAATAAVSAPKRSAPSEEANQFKTQESASKAKPSAQDVQRATDDLQRRVSTLAPELQFSVDKTSGRSIIKFTDRATNEVVRQFPSEEALQLTKVMDQYQRGLLFNKKA